MTKSNAFGGEKEKQKEQRYSVTPFVTLSK